LELFKQENIDEHVSTTFFNPWSCSSKKTLMNTANNASTSVFSVNLKQTSKSKFILIFYKEGLKILQNNVLDNPWTSNAPPPFFFGGGGGGSNFMPMQRYSSLDKMLMKFLSHQSQISRAI